MNKFYFFNKITSLIFGIFSNALCVLIFIIISFIFLGKGNFGYLTGLFILENILILFDLSINYYIIKRLSLANAIAKSKIIIFFIGNKYFCSYPTFLSYILHMQYCMCSYSLTMEFCMFSYIVSIGGVCV